MPNPTGINGYGTNPVVSDAKISALLTSLAFENGGNGVSREVQLMMLERKLGLKWKKSKLTKERKRLAIPSVRCNPATRQQQLEGLTEVGEDNPGGSWGTGQIRGRLAGHGILTSRKTVREYSNTHFPAEVDHRMAMTRKTIPRTPLQLKGPLHQVHWDGHEKLSSQALNIHDDIGLCFYGGRCAWSSRIVALVVAPNVRDQATVAHIFLDWVIAEGYVVPFVNITDKGSEVGEMQAIQTRLRILGRPDFDPAEFPPTREVKSTHNTPIEGLWRWQRQSGGRDIKDEIIGGTYHFNAALPFHKFLFYWVWVPLVQEQLNNFVTYYNAHRLRTQQNKNAPTGVSPNLLSTMPDYYDNEARDCRVRVMKEWVDEERERLGGLEARERLFEWYPASFGQVAEEVWKSIGCPTRRLNSAWAMFTSMSAVMEQPGFWAAPA